MNEQILSIESDTRLFQFIKLINIITFIHSNQQTEKEEVFFIFNYN